MSKKIINKYNKVGILTTEDLFDVLKLTAKDITIAEEDVGSDVIVFDLAPCGEHRYQLTVKRDTENEVSFSLWWGDNYGSSDRIRTNDDLKDILLKLAENVWDDIKDNEVQNNAHYVKSLHNAICKLYESIRNDMLTQRMLEVCSK